MSISSAIKKAKEVIKEVGINQFPIDLDEILSQYKLSSRPYDFGKDISGALFVENDVATIGYNPYESGVRRRFTIAHELGHYFVHGLERSRSKIFVDKKKFGYFRNDDSTKGEILREKEANAFAAELLMPEELLDKELPELIREKPNYSDEEVIGEMAKMFNVSSIAMSHRLTNLGLFQPHLGLLKRNDKPAF